MTDDQAEKICERNLKTEGRIPKCKVCGKTPENVGWCDQCGYNRPYEMIRSSTVN